MRIVLCVLLMSSVALGGCAGESQESPFRPVASVSQLMSTMMDPAADVVWDAVGTVVSNDGVEHWEPETDEEWGAVLNAAMTVTESANLLMIGDRARDQETWMRMAQAMVAAGQLAIEAAENQDVEAIYGVGEAVYNACDSCHTLYWIGDADRGKVAEENP
jgi:hypothetical protein